MADYTVVTPAGPVTLTASAAVTGGQQVEVTGPFAVGPAAAASAKVVGQALHDAPINGSVTVYLRGPLAECTTSAAVTAGASLAAAATGRVATAGADEPILGVALSTATSGATVTYVGL